MNSKNNPNRITKIQYERYLNDLGFPEDYIREREGKQGFNKRARYGSTLKRSDPIAFDVGFQEWRRKKELAVDNR